MELVVDLVLDQTSDSVKFHGLILQVVPVDQQTEDDLLGNYFDFSFAGVGVASASLFRSVLATLLSLLGLRCLFTAHAGSSIFV